MNERPNVLVFFTDDQRFDTIGALGNPAVATPHLDALVGCGTTFTRAHIPGGTSGAVCMPSRAMLHTGRRLFDIDGEGQRIPAAHTTMGACFQAAGYETFGTGKWHNGRESYARSFSCGDEIFFGGMADHWNVPVYRFDPSGRYGGRLPFVPDPHHSNETRCREGDHIHAGAHSTDLFVEATEGFLRERDPGRPFFAYVALMAPHDPRTMPARFLDMYDPAAVELPASFLPEHPFDNGALRVRDELLSAFPRTEAEVRRHLAEYYAMISHLDAGFGRLMAALEAEGARDNTIVVFAGDNGLALGQHGLMGKQSLYEHSVRVPLVLAGPGLPRAERRDALVYLLDIFPTLCELTATPVPASVQGRSLAGIAAGTAESGYEELYLAYTDSIRGVSDGRGKLLEYAGGETQLFDLERDPLETRNLAGDDETKVSRMRETLRRLAVEWRDEEHRLGAAFWARRPDLAQ